MARKKKCPKCPKSKGPQLLSAFNKNAGLKDGHQSYCRECQKASGRVRTVAKVKAKGGKVPKTTRRASTRQSRSTPAFVIGRTEVPEALRLEIQDMAWDVLRKQLKRLKKRDQRIVRMYAMSQGVEV